MRFVLCICAVLALGLTLALPGCGEDSPPPQAPIQPTESAFDRQVRENCEIVAAAAEAFFDARGEYPKDMWEFKAWLPDAKLLINPATGEATEPMMPDTRNVLLDPHAPGSVGMRIFRRLDPDNSYRRVELGYYIVGRGEHCDIVLTNVPEDELARDRDRTVIENCRIVVAAARAFAADNDGVFAFYNEQVNNAGMTIQDYLPGGILLTNPYYEFRRDPLWGAAAAAEGEIGYIGIDPDGDGNSDGYIVDAVGSVSGTTLGYFVYPPEIAGWPTPPEVDVQPCAGTTSP